jgi:hypothetical protein
MDDPFIRLAVTELAEILMREGYLDNVVDARRAAKRLIEEVNEMSDGDDGELAGR